MVVTIGLLVVVLEVWEILLIMVIILVEDLVVLMLVVVMVLRVVLMGVELMDCMELVESEVLLVVETVLWREEEVVLD